MRSMEMSAKTVEDAVQAACDALGVDRDDINVSYEVLEFPARKLFKTIPAKVLVKVEEPEAELGLTAAGFLQTQLGRRPRGSRPCRTARPGSPCRTRCRCRTRPRR